MALNPDREFINVKGVGVLGWNAFDDASVIEDNELADVQNMVVRDGFLAPREGTTLLYEKPAGETADPLQIMVAKTSDGINYTIAVYGNKFYVWHPDTEEWIRFNQSYVPVETTLRYGYVNWNGGRGDDRFYFGNGTDSNGRWDMCVTTVGVSASATTTALTLTDGSRFPTSGWIVIENSAGNLYREEYTSRTGNVLTLASGGLDYDVVAGAPVVMDIIEKSSMQKGKIMQKYDQRLFIANYPGGEVVVWGSVKNTPEDFTVGTSIASAFTQDIPDGEKEIKGLKDFGDFLGIFKEDSIHALRITIDSTLADKIINVRHLTSGVSMGPTYQPSLIKVMGQVYYATRNNGFMSVNPQASGDSNTTVPQFLSQKINPYIKAQLDISEALAVSSDNKILWAVKKRGGANNTIVLEYDLLRNAWLKHTGLACKSIEVLDNDFIYLDTATGNVIKLFDGTYHDQTEGYLSSAYMKTFDFGVPAHPKSQNYLFVQGLLTPASDIYVDVFYNEGSTSLGKLTYRINKDTDGISLSNTLTDSMGAFVLGEPVLGMGTFSGVKNVQMFRCYLALPSKYQFFTVQPRFYSQKPAFWSIQSTAFDVVVEPVVAKSMQVSPIN